MIETFKYETPWRFALRLYCVLCSICWGPEPLFLSNVKWFSSFETFRHLLSGFQPDIYIKKKKNHSREEQQWQPPTDRPELIPLSHTHYTVAPATGDLNAPTAVLKSPSLHQRMRWWSFTLRLRGSQQITQGKWWFLHRYHTPSDQRHKRQRADKSHWDSESGTGRLCGTTGGTLAVSCCF